MRSVTHNPDYGRYEPECTHRCPNCGEEHECGNGTRCTAPKAMPCSKVCERILDNRIEEMTARLSEEEFENEAEERANI